MKFFFVATAVCLAFSPNAAAASAEPSEKDAIALVEHSVALMKSTGKDEVIKRINAKDPEFVRGSMYVLVRDLKTSTILAHPINYSLVGKDLSEVPDTSGKKFRLEIIDKAAKQGTGWVDYSYKNPATGKIEPKTSYLQRFENLVVEAGIYRK